MSGYFEGSIAWQTDETAYYPNVAKQVENTLKNIQGTELWEVSNEYDRFYERLNGNYTKDMILGGK